MARQFTVAENQRFFTEHGVIPDAGRLTSSVILSRGRRYIGQHCLDVGAGEGSLLKKFYDRYPRRDIRGYDISPRSKLVFKGDCTDIADFDETYDTVFCTDVIEHLSDSDLPKCISEINRVLTVGGHVILSTNNSEDFTNNIVTCPDCCSRFHRTGHCQQFSVARLTELFRDHGFEVVLIRELNLGFISSLGLLAKMFYLFRLERIVKAYRFVSDIFFVAQKV